MDFLNLNGKSVQRVGNQLILYYNSQHQFLNIVYVFQTATFKSLHKFDCLPRCHLCRTDVELQLDHSITTKELGTFCFTFKRNLQSILYRDNVTMSFSCIGQEETRLPSKLVWTLMYAQ